MDRIFGEQLTKKANSQKLIVDPISLQDWTTYFTSTLRDDLSNSNQNDKIVITNSRTRNDNSAIYQLNTMLTKSISLEELKHCLKKLKFK